jgi:hypothetical protein
LTNPEMLAFACAAIAPLIASACTSTADQMAAVAIVKQGFERFFIVGGGAQNNTRLITTGPTYANTTGTFSQSGNMIYGNTSTTFGGRQVFVAGRHDAQLGVVMFNPGDQGYGNALDVKTTLGKDWEKKVKNGFHTCL